MFIKNQKKNNRNNSKEIKKRKLTIWQKIWRVIAVGYILAAFVAIGSLIYLLILLNQLPSVEQLLSHKHELPTIIFDNQGKKIFEYYDQKRILLDDNEIPILAKNTLVASEDSRFYSHFGIDVFRIIKAFIVNARQFRIAQGASTITQQTAKLYFLSPEKTIKRKLSEMLLAFKMERNFSKDQILGFYLNKAYFGRHSYGIEAAAITYFDKKTSELTIAEMATIIGLLPAPSRYSPTVNIEAATNRRNLVLGLMLKNEYIDNFQHDLAVNTPIILNINEKAASNNSSFFSEEIRRYLVANYGAEEVIKGGMKVYSTLDLKFQSKAQKSLQTGLIAIEKRHGYRGALDNIDEITIEEIDYYEDKIGNNSLAYNSLNTGRVTNLDDQNAALFLNELACGMMKLSTTSWAIEYDLENVYSEDQSITDLTTVISRGDYLEITIKSQLTNEDKGILVALEPDCHDDQKILFEVELTPLPAANGAILVVNSTNGHVLAMSGGYSFGKSQFNLVTQSYRPSGSAFKPFVYLTALEEGYLPSTILEDSPISFSASEINSTWIPKNYSTSFTGPISFRDALVYSKNIPTVRLARDVGINNILDVADSLLIDTTKMQPNLSTALGSGSVNLWDMVRSYSVFALNGSLIEPIYILKIEDRDGNILEENFSTIYPEVVDPANAFIINDILTDVNKRGTGRSAKILGEPSAGKTGTTNNNSNAWYVGYIPGIISGVYVGNDNFKITLGKNETGSRAAQPIWVDFMDYALEYVTDATPSEIPADVIKVEITKNGKLYCDTNVYHYPEYFKIDQQPQICDKEYGSYIPEVPEEELVNNINDATIDNEQDGLVQIKQIEKEIQQEEEEDLNLLLNDQL